LTLEQDAMLRTIFAQITGDVDGRGPDGWGWPSFRYGGGPDLTPVDLLRHIDREVNTRFNLTGRLGPDLNTLVGQVMSLRAEVRQLRALLFPER
jgi:hypothetical protein